MHVICQIQILTVFAEKFDFVGRFNYQLPSKAAINRLELGNISSLVKQTVMKAVDPDPKTTKNDVF